MQLLVSFAVILDLVLAQAECTRLGGSCVPVSSCENAHSDLVSGLCPGPADIRCCVPVGCNIPAPTAGLVFPGRCRPTSTCTGQRGSRLCPGAADIQCCSTATAAVKDPVLAIGTTNLTPRGNRLIVQSDAWKVLQLQRPFVGSFAQKAQCANNVSKVISMAGFDPYYNSPLVMDMILAIKKVTPSANLGRDYLYTEPKRSSDHYAREFNKVYGGYFPIGTMVAGCKVPNCEGTSGDGHISFVCKVTDAVVDSSGQLTKANFHLCHNNWLRKNVDPSIKMHDTLGKIGDYMINQTLYKAGVLERQWMSTPWLQLHWKDGKVSRVVSLFPEIDDLDPFLYHMYIAVPFEISSQLSASDRKYRAPQ